MGWRYHFPSIQSLKKLSTLPPSGHLLQGIEAASSIQKTFHYSHPRYQIRDKSSTTALTDETALKYEYIEDCEPLERYRPGGFAPIKLGDRLGGSGGRYSVVQNLGFGGSSTVWLASDQKKQELVAIKIKTANSAALETESQGEVEILKQLQLQHGRRPLLIRKLLDSFVEDSPNGSHHCLVMEAASCSLMQSKSLVSHGLLHLPTARAIAADLVLTVQFLHEQGIVHGGELDNNCYLNLHSVLN